MPLYKIVLWLQLRKALRHLTKGQDLGATVTDKRNKLTERPLRARGGSRKPQSPVHPPIPWSAA